MKYYYKALYTDPGSADLVYAKLKQQFPDLEMHIHESDRPYGHRDLFHSMSDSDTEIGGELAFTMLAPLTNQNLSPAEIVSNNNTGLTPSPYGAIDFLLEPHESFPDSSARAVIYGSCEKDIQSAVTQNLRRYGADSVMLSKTPI